MKLYRHKFTQSHIRLQSNSVFHYIYVIPKFNCLSLVIFIDVINTKTEQDRFKDRAFQPELPF